MLNDDVQLISVNDHIVEPPGVFRDRLPAKWVEQGPTRIDTPGAQAWRVGSETIVAVSTSLQEGEPPAEEQVARVDRMWAAAGDPVARLAAMDADRIAAQALFPHAMGFAGEKLRFLSDELWGLCAAAYNDFVLCEYCAADPGRLVGIGILPLADPRAAAAEVERMAALGGRGVSFPHNPAHLGLPSLYDQYWAPVFDAIEAARLPLFIHIGTGTPLITAPGAPFEVLLTLATLDALTAMTDLAFGPVLVGRPDLRVVVLEAGISWIPYLTERIDYFWARQGSTAGGREPPSQRLRRQVLAAFIDDPAGMGLIDDVGVERVLWQSDFPHPDSAWPGSRERLARSLAGLADAKAAAIAEGNARSLLRLPRLPPSP
jgi:predicted TIM-barrel fold metal-dependent hydrolase